MPLFLEEKRRQRDALSPSEGTAVPGLLEAFDRPFLYLADTFLGEVVFLTDLFDGHAIFAVEAKIRIDNFSFPGAE